MKILVFDFEVFKYDVLLGVYDVNNKQYIQLWDKEQIKQFYRDNINSIWVGHNNQKYDNIILQAIINNKNPYDISQNIVEHEIKYNLKIKLYYYDIMQWHFVSLKTLEAYMGKNISESEVDFNIDRPLTQEEKELTESYNRDDLDQTFLDLKLVKSEFQLRFDLIKEFKLPLDALHWTEAQIAAYVLKSKRIDNIENMPLHPIIYPELKIKNEKVLDFYLKEKFKDRSQLKLDLCGVEHTIASGGIHASEKKCHYDWAFYCDVSGYYNLTMMNYNLFSRTISEEGKKLYEFMYHEQLRLKKIDPIKRGIYKVILLAVFGAQMNKYTDFYDPYNGTLVPIVGQMFLVDLLEKLEGKIKLIQSNTDGIIVKPLCDENIVRDIIHEWENRTHFTLKFDKIYDIYQRDVNCYMYRDEKGNIHTKGGTVKYYDCWQNPFTDKAYNSGEPIIYNYTVTEYYMNGIKPEETIEKLKNEPRLFQYIIKKGVYDYLEYNNKKLQNVNRCFAAKNGHTVYKCKQNKHDKYQNLPESVIIYNEDLSNFNCDIIDYDYYIKRSYEKLTEFKKDYEQLELF